MHPHPVAVVTGANRGLGLESARQLLEAGWSVVLTGRDPEALGAAAAELSPQEGRVAETFVLDVTDEARADALDAHLREGLGRLDALVNNAGAIFEDPSAANTRASSAEAVLRTLDTNAVGAYRVDRALLPLLAEGEGGNLVHVSSGMGGLAEMGGGYPGYRLSKAAMNALTRVVHAEWSGQGVRANSVCPGWVRTDMGGPSATRAIPDGARGIVWAATLPEGGPSGGFFRDGEPIAW